MLNDTLSCSITEELNGAYELDAEHPLDARLKWQELLEGNIIKADGQLFRIYRKQKTLNGIKVNARHIFYDLLDNFLEDVRPENLNGASALDWILTRTQYAHPFSSMSDVSTIATKYFIRKNVVEAIMGSDGIISTWGGELVRDNFTIKLLQSRGSDRGVLVAYGKNIQGIEETLDTDGICTRLMPLGKDALQLPEKYIDSPCIDNFPHPKIRVIEFSDIETVEELRTAAQKYMLDNKIDIPTANYKVDFIELTKTDQYKNYAILETVNEGDTVTVKHSKLNINLKCKVIKITKNDLTNRIEKVELGSFKQNIASSINTSIQAVKKDIVETKSSLQAAIDNATIQINSALGGYALKRNGEFLIMDTEDPNTATEVWRWNRNGLGYSATGYNGPYRTAITSDGHFVADFIDAGTLTAEIIKTGILKSFNSVSWLNMADGTFNFANKIIFDGTNFSINVEAIKIGFNQITDRVLIDSSGISIKEGGLNLLANDGSSVGWFGSTGGGFSRLRVSELIADNSYSIQSQSLTLYVDGTYGNDNNTGTSSSKLKSINEALRRVNKIILNGVEVDIYVNGTCAETVVVENFLGSGILKIVLDVNCVIQGSFVVTGCNTFVSIEGGRDGVNSSVLGALITPQYGRPAVEIVNCNAVQVYGVRAKLNYSNGLIWNRSKGLCIYNDISGCAGNTAICAQNCATVFNYGNRGSNNAYSYWVSNGGIIIGGNSASPVSSNGIANDGGSIQTGTLTGTETQDASSRPSTQTYTTQWTATQTDSWRPSVWRSDTNDIYQGEWSGYGQHRGFMCFNSADIRNALSGATINNARIYMTRKNSGGSSAAVNMHWYGHGYDSTGGGYDLSTDFGYNGALAWGAAGWIGLPASVGNSLRDNGIHGLALYDGSSNYSIYTGMPVLEITYTK